MYLSYSGFKVASDCLFRYWLTYVGKVEAPAEDVLGSIYGSAVGLLFEEFYRKRLWNMPNVREHMEGEVERIVDFTLAEGLRSKHGRTPGFIKWRGAGEGQNPRGLYANREELVSDVRFSVARGLSTIRTHRLLGPQVDAELKLDAVVNGHTLGGRADFVMTRVKPFGDLVILDGKGSRKRERYVSSTQLMWYSMLYAEHHKRVPDKVAFVYWHFDPPSNIDWCGVTEAETKALKTKALRMIQTLSALEGLTGASRDLGRIQAAFTPKANSQNCRFCPYATKAICPKGARIVAELERKRMESQDGVLRSNSSSS